MMVCMPRTCGVFSRTLSVFGRGCPWCAEARAALQQGRSDQSIRHTRHRATALDPSERDRPPTEGRLLPRSCRAGWAPERTWPSAPIPTQAPHPVPGARPRSSSTP